MSKLQLTLAQWCEKAESMFGKDMKQWKFQCPSCKESQSLNEFIDTGVKEPETKVYFSCIGRFVKGRGCDWTLGGLLQIHQTEVISEEGKPVPVFEFAEPVSV